MLGIILSAVGLIVIVMIVNQGEEISILSAIGVSLVVTIVGALLGIALENFGIVGLVLNLILYGVLAGLIIGFWLGMTLQRAMIAGFAFLIYQIVLALVFHLLMQSIA